jgi:hypothetical protein
MDDQRRDEGVGCARKPAKKPLVRRCDRASVEPKVFEKESAGEIAASLKRSAESSDRRKASPFRSARSMLTFYINRAGRNLSPERKRTLEAAKEKLRKRFGHNQ